MWITSVEDMLSAKADMQRRLLLVVLSGDPPSDLGPFDRLMGDHMRRVQGLTARAAAWLGLGPEKIWVIGYAALLHDLGKVGLPPSIVNKPGKLSEGEWEIVRQHPKIGADLLSEISGPKRVRDVVAAHHERPDGGGYPAGLAGPDIPIEARLIAVADAYDAMTNDRPYRAALSHDRAIEQLNLGSGSQFDPMAIEAVEAVLTQALDKDFRVTGTSGDWVWRTNVGSLAQTRLATRVLVLPGGHPNLRGCALKPVVHE
jgi:putative nucleotidyltransferase with HDIG domain